ncbi:putative lipoprotein [Synechococcus sp. BIOS-U3-1]|nr:putative lipoprotein [Synechococcus sp. BIOS-U3-1]
MFFRWQALLGLFQLGCFSQAASLRLSQSTADEMLFRV